MNHYLVKLNIQTDFSVYKTSHIIKATHSDKAVQLALMSESTEGIEQDKTGAYDISTGDYFAVDSCKLINPMDLAILKAYLGTNL